MENEVNEKLNQQAITFLKDEVEKLAQAMIKGFQDINSKLEVLSEHYVRRDELDRNLATRDKEIEELKSNQRWVARSIIGVVITALLGLIILNK